FRSYSIIEKTQHQPVAQSSVTSKRNSVYRREMSQKSKSESVSKSSKSKRSRHPRSRSSKSEREERYKNKKEYTDKELFNLAARSRDRQAIREFEAAICCHGLTENGVRRAKQRQDIYFVLKGFLLYIQMICALLVSLTAVIVFQHLHRGMESVYFASELAIEVILLLFILLIIEVELQVLRYAIPIVMLTVFFINTVQIAYYVHFDSIAIECKKAEEMEGSFPCYLKNISRHHLSTYVAAFLALLHIIGFISGLLLVHYYYGTILHLIKLARAVAFTSCVTFFEEAARAKKRNRRRARRKKRSEKAIKRAYVPRVDATKLPVGSVITAERSVMYKFKGNVQPHGVVIGSGQETINDSVTVQAPNKEAVKRESKIVRHVMVDGVRKKVVPSTTKSEIKEGKGSSKSSPGAKPLSQGKSLVKTGDVSPHIPTAAPSRNVGQEMQPRDPLRSLFGSPAIKKD
ncbi:hypothetical protein V3C99_001363, partial [Haemonchus contortus]